MCLKSEAHVGSLPKRSRLSAPDRAARAKRIWSRHSLIGIAIVSVLAISSARAAPPTPLPPDAQQAMAVAEVVLGIISYTTWPTPPEPLRVCILEQPGDLERRLLDGSRIGATRVRAAAISIADPRLGADCNVVFSGALTPADRVVLRDDIQGHPVLTIDEDDTACSGLVMFCLTPSGTRVDFSVNLDSVARSGLEVNPQVLLLGRRRAVAP